MTHITQEQAAILARDIWGETAILPMVDLHKFAQAVIDSIDTSQERVEKGEESVQMVHYKRGYGVALSDAEEAIDDECRERVVTASDCIEIIRNLGAEPEVTE